MIKLMIVGVWVCLVALGTAFATVSWEGRHVAKVTEEKSSDGLAPIKTRMISVPVVVDGALQGYVMAQLVVAVDAKAVANHSAMKPDLYIMDEAFKTLYSEEVIDFRRLRKQDLAKLSAKIAENINKRLGKGFAREVLIENLNYIPKGEARNMRKS